MNKTLEYYLSLDYPVEIRRIDESLGGGYVATIPSLGSQAFVGDGDTPQQAYDNLQAAKKEIFAEYLHHGVPIPEPVAEPDYETYSGRLVVRMPRQLHASLAAAARRSGTSLNQFINYALANFETGWSTVQELKEVMWSQPLFSATSGGHTSVLGHWGSVASVASGSSEKTRTA